MGTSYSPISKTKGEFCGVSYSVPILEHSSLNSILIALDSIKRRVRGWPEKKIRYICFGFRPLDGHIGPG
jgi:hypothetical protein